MAELARIIEHAGAVLPAHDPRLRYRSIVEVFSSSFDPDRAGAMTVELLPACGAPL